MSWAENVLPSLKPESDESLSCSEQVEAEFYGFRDGMGLSYGTDIRCLREIKDAVWELKTDDIRLFGWFPFRNLFVVHIAEIKSNLKKNEQYTPFVKAVVDFRNNLKSSLPVHIPGAKLSDVISNRVGSVR